MIRSLLYALARFLGNLTAIKNGPVAIAKRAARKAAGRGYGSIIRRIIK